MLATIAICADTTQDAAHAASSVQQWRASGLQGPIPEPRAPGEPQREAPSNPLRVLPARQKPLLFGTPDHVRAELEKLAGSFGADEVLLVTITHDHEVRVRSHELLAEAFGLTPR